MMESYRRLNCRTMSVLSRYPVIVLEKNAVEDYLKINCGTTENGTKKVGSKLSRVEIKEEVISETSPESRVKTEAGIDPHRIKSEVGISVSSGDGVYPDKKPWISDLVVKIKTEKHEPDVVTYELVKSLPGHSVDENQKPLRTIKCESVENGNYVSDKTNISASNVRSGDKSTFIDAFEEHLRSSYIHSNVFLDSKSNKAVDPALTLKNSRSMESENYHNDKTNISTSNVRLGNESTFIDAFEKYLRSSQIQANFFLNSSSNNADVPLMLKESSSEEYQKGVLNKYSRSCFYCQGEFRDISNARCSLNNQCFDSKKESEVQNTEKQSSHNHSIVKFNKESTSRKHSDAFGVKRLLHCKQCCAKFQCNSELKRHMKAHSDERAFKCKQCLVKFKSSRNLKSHLMTHSNDKPFRCNLCPKNFKHVYLLKRHLRVHSDERFFKCDKCPSAFKYEGGLIYHLTEHSNERLFECKFCGAKFKRQNALNGHMRMHSDERPVKCKVCPARFKHQRGLRQRVSLHTDKKSFTKEQESAALKPSKVSERQMLLHNDQGPFDRKLCVAKFKRNDIFKNHLKLHSDERPVICEGYPVKFKNNRILRNPAKGQHLKAGSVEERSKNAECLKTFENCVGSIEQTILQKEETIFPPTSSSNDDWSPVATVAPMTCRSNFTSSKLNGGMEPSGKTVIPDELRVNLSVGKPNKRLELCPKDGSGVEEPFKINECPRTFENCVGSIEPTIFQKEERSFQRTNSLSNDQLPVDSVMPMKYRSNVTFSKLNSAVESSSETVISDKPLVNLPVGVLDERQVCNIEKPSECEKSHQKFETCAGVIELTPLMEGKSAQPINHPSNDLSPFAAVEPETFRSCMTSPKLNGALEPSCKTVISDEGHVNPPVRENNEIMELYLIEANNVGELPKCDIQTFDNFTSLIEHLIAPTEESFFHSTNSLSSDLAVNLPVREMNEIMELYPIKGGNLEPSKCDECLETFDNCASLIEHLIPRRDEGSLQPTNSPRDDLAQLAPISPKACPLNGTSPKLNGATKPNCKTVIPGKPPVNLPVPSVREMNERMEFYLIEANTVGELPKCDIQTFDNFTSLIEHLIAPTEESSFHSTNSLSSDLAVVASVSPTTCRSSVTSPELNGATKFSCKTLISDEQRANLPVGEMNEIMELYSIKAGNLKLSKFDECLEPFDNGATLIEHLIPPGNERSLQPTNSPRDDFAQLALISPKACPLNGTSLELNGAMKPNCKTVIPDKPPVNLPVGEINEIMELYPIKAGNLELPKCDEFRETYDNCASVIEHLIPPGNERSLQPTNAPRDDLAQLAPISPKACPLNGTSPKLNGATKPNCKTVIPDKPPVSLSVGEMNEIKPYLVEAGNKEEPSKCDQCFKTFENCSCLIKPIPPREVCSSQRTNSPSGDRSPTAAPAPRNESHATFVKFTHALESSNKTLISEDLLVNLPVKELNKILKPCLKETVSKYKEIRRTLKNRSYARNCRSKRIRERRGLEKQNKALQAELSLVKEGIKKVMKHCTCGVERKISGEPKEKRAW